jgi:CheY-like chemotaxis protein
MVNSIFSIIVTCGLYFYALLNKIRPQTLPTSLPYRPSSITPMTSTQLICVVDDQADYRFLIQQLFSRFLPNYSVRLFANGKALVEELPQISPKPSLFLLDRHMPILDGHQTLLYLKGHEGFKTIPVVIMSADASWEEINECYEAGANSFVRKAMDFESVKHIMTGLCEYWLNVNQGSIYQLGVER